MRLLSYSSWFCLASTTSLIQIRSGTEHRIPFLLLSCLHELSPVFYGFFPQLLVLFGFHNLLNTNPKRSGTSDSILTFEQPAIISWFCMASFPPRVIISWFLWLLPHSLQLSPGFVWLLSHSCGTNNPLNTNPKRSRTSDFILTFVQEQLSVSYVTRTGI